MLAPPGAPAPELFRLSVGQYEAMSRAGILTARDRVELVDGLVRRIRREIPGGDQAIVIATGGLAPVLSAETEAVQHVDGELTLDGLRLIWERNRET